MNAMSAALASSCRPINSWKSTLSVGNENIDNDHRYLFYLAAKVRAEVLGANNPNAVRFVLDALLTYAQEHFQREEALMKEIRYADQDEHAMEHRLLTYHLRKLYYRSAGGDRVTNEDLDIFLDRWMARHILTADLDLAKSIREAHPHTAQMLA